MRTPLALMCAMDDEVQLYLDQCEIQASTERAGLTFHEAQWHGHNLVVVRAGVGKVNAALSAQLLITEYNAAAVVCTGTAGAVSPELDIGDIVVAEDCVQHDVLVDFLNLPRGQIPFTDHRFFETGPELRAEAAAVALHDRTIHVGRVLTGDTFVEDEEYRRTLRDELDGDCVEMEGAAVGQVCTRNDVPFLVVRAISDRADGTSDIDFKSFHQDAAKASAQMVLTVLKGLDPDGRADGRW